MDKAPRLGALNAPPAAKMSMTSVLAGLISTAIVLPFIGLAGRVMYEFITWGWNLWPF